MSDEKTDIEIVIDAKSFNKRARSILSAWKAQNKSEGENLFQSADVILIVIGNLSDANPYQKSSAVQQWLFGDECNDMLILITHDTFHIITGESNVARLEELKQTEKSIPIEIYARSKNLEKDRTLFENVVNIIKSTEEKRVGILPKDKFSGTFVQDWQAVYESNKSNFHEVDVSLRLASLLAIKDEDEQGAMRSACKVTSIFMKRAIEMLSGTIDDDKKMTHEKLAEDIDNIINDAKVWKEHRSLLQNIDANRLEWCYQPIIQSGGVYDLRPSASSNSNILHSGTILCSLGVRYRSYCSNIGRTIIIEPNKEQENNYNFLLELQRRILSTIRDGVKIRDVYSKALVYVRNKRPDLVKHFVKNIGSSIGIEFRESQYLLNAKNTQELKNGMILNLSIGFQDLSNPEAKDEESKIYALLLIDTIRVTNDTPVMLTDVKKKLNDVCYYFSDDEAKEQNDTENKRKTKRPEPKKPQSKQSAVLKTKFRSEEQGEETPEQRRKRHQKELAIQKQAEGIARFADGVDQQSSQRQAVFRKFESYKRDTALPKEIVVDLKNETIVLPIFGFAVPFHISALKNATKTEEGEYVYLRLNFLTPGQATGKKEDMPFDDPNANFVRAVTYRSTDLYLSEIYKKILDLKKTATKKEVERKEMADIIEQDKLMEVKGRRPQRLSEVYARPVMEGKRNVGELEIHQNGLRYQSSRSSQKIDILFGNIKHLFFQPCDNELIVILHIHLKNPIIIGKKKTKDIQFYREAADVQFDETTNRKRRYRYGDEDELGAEQEERRRRALLNKEFKMFAEKIAEASEGRVEVDIPFRELGFSGVPFRTNVLLQPTLECLVHLTDPPFLVITIADIEVAHLERVQYGLRNFDMVFVFKDYSRTPVHINTIPMEQLENVKEWLDNVDVSFTEGSVNLDWSKIMRTINADPAGFFKGKGWAFLQPDSENEGSDMSSDDASEFMPSDDDYGDSSSDESSYDEEASEASVSTESSDSAPDWDELEEKARRADERKQGIKRKEETNESGNKKKYRRT
ncbi:423_t:CDS:10 [Paraglomus brasilianum]|uniref:FACT complex subunit n=1 Tax=Paraglomus brasilianum TaxID=144538 RepID=A0A9N8YRP0_9GLOM|nr:423_t:CDS:10 [Paraglomus brasilianum]